MIQMKNVTKKYSNGVVAVNGISVHIRPGEFVYVVGPSGAGKSTFIKLMYREEKATSGSVVINGIDLSTLKNRQVPAFRRNVGVVFQDFKLLPRLTAYENIAFALEVTEEEPATVTVPLCFVPEYAGASETGIYFSPSITACPSADIMKSMKSCARGVKSLPVTMLKGRDTAYLPAFTFSAVASTPSTLTAFTVSLSEPRDT